MEQTRGIACGETTTQLENNVAIIKIGGVSVPINTEVTKIADGVSGPDPVMKEFEYSPTPESVFVQKSYSDYTPVTAAQFVRTKPDRETFHSETGCRHDCKQRCGFEPPMGGDPEKCACHKKGNKNHRYWVWSC